jgi:hypothetical protein
MTDAFPSDPLAEVRNPDGTVDWPAVGEAQQARRHGRATTKMIAVLDWLHANGGTFYVVKAAQKFAEHHREQIREHGGTLITTTSRNGRTTTTRRIYPAPKVAQAGRVRATPRAARPRARRTSSSSRTSGTDPSDSDPHSAGPPPLRLWRHPKYGATSPNLLLVLLDAGRVSP